MPQYLLRVEAVNLDPVLADTDDLSTRRGGGLLLLNAVRQMVGDPTAVPPIDGTLTPKKLRDRLHSIATGASVGLFSFEATDDTEAEAVRTSVADHFRTGTFEYEHPQDKSKTEHVQLAYGTFAVDVEPLSADPPRAVAAAIAANRWRQMREPSVSVLGAWDKADRDCELDCVRPATRSVLRGDEWVRTSASVADRRGYGRTSRQKFYERELGRTPRFEFTDTLEELSKPHAEIKNAVPATAADKLAVLYMDGNNFGEYGREGLAHGLERYGGWSDALRDYHRKRLGELIATAENDRGWRTENAIRLETLLWGGDELLWVVPAWKGWELVEWFFGGPHPVGGRTLSYGAGLVFCHATAPIQDVIELAHDKLAEAAKKVGRDANRSLVAYEVLESFDDIHGDLAEHRRRWLPPGTPADDLLLDPAKLTPDGWGHLRRIAASRDFPLRQLYRLCKLWRTGEHGAEREKALKRLREGEAGEHFRAVEAALGSVGWLHLLQMLPYLPEAA